VTGVILSEAKDLKLGNLRSFGVFAPQDDGDVYPRHSPDAVGYPNPSHARKPPRRAEAPWMPFLSRMSTELALVSSAGHVQYVTIGLSFGRFEISPSSCAIAMCSAPGM
jgi:hypothetical protein